MGSGISTVSDTAISVHGVSKTFAKKRKQHSIKSSIIDAGNSFIGKKEKEHVAQTFNALDNVSFDIKKGEFFGIVGRNGSGKSTLLKILAGVYTPSKGSVAVRGKLTPFIELGVGFNPELTGHDNLFLNGALLGFTRKEMSAMYKNIVEFAELEEFMDVKLKNYSSGMQVRLAFSIATRCQSDILLLDEVLAVGDAVFQQKCFDYFAEIKKTGRTVCFVSHDADTMRKYCDRGVLIKHGQVQVIGSITSVLDAYQKDLTQTIEKQEEKKIEKQPEKKQYSDIKLASLKVSQVGSTGRSIKAHQDFELKIRVVCAAPVPDANIGINILSQQGQLIHAFNSQQLGHSLDLTAGQNDFTFIIDNVLTDGKYDINVAIVSIAGKKLLFQQESAGSFKVAGVKGHKYSLIHPKVTMGER